MRSSASCLKRSAPLPFGVSRATTWLKFQHDRLLRDCCGAEGEHGKARRPRRGEGTCGGSISLHGGNSAGPPAFASREGSCNSGPEAARTAATRLVRHESVGSVAGLAIGFRSIREPAAAPRPEPRRSIDKPRFIKRAEVPVASHFFVGFLTVTAGKARKDPHRTRWERRGPSHSGPTKP